MSSLSQAARHNRLMVSLENPVLIQSPENHVSLKPKTQTEIKKLPRPANE